MKTQEEAEIRKQLTDLKIITINKNILRKRILINPQKEKLSFFENLLFDEPHSKLQIIYMADCFLIYYGSSKINLERFKNIYDLAIYCAGIFHGIASITTSGKLVDNYNKLILDRVLHTNRKGKEWRDKLYELANKEYGNNKHTDKTKALRTGFEKLPEKELYRTEFDLKFDSIYRKFTKSFN